MKPISFSSLRFYLVGVVCALNAILASDISAQSKSLPNAIDHPLIKPFQDSRITAYAQTEWTEASLPQAKSSKQDASKTLDLRTVEGKETRIHYLSPVGKTVLEVHRNYRDALLAAGLQITMSCEQQCEHLYRLWRNQAKPFERQFKWDDGHHHGFSHYDAPDDNDGRMIVGFFPANPQRSKTHVLIYHSTAFGGGKKVDPMVSSFLQIIEEKAQPQGQVTVNADALKQSLQKTGHASLYGLLFDTGKSELKPESQAQLQEMIATLKAQPQWKLIIVGHTDNVGSIDNNLALSQARAQSVVHALIQAGIDKQRLLAKGLANFAPVASNANEEGRALNRRVEIVLQ
ncbi:OmpA family protein [Undibacterium cyanobacteriorum]|uniref:OmpA family protein n=1 Tax=Undibacterium cyanobacteriorum TaxID=3073561 RepID=A0ABY9RKR6_9BURK|nr:OmpA family protein [Undibacterium sp. 20NA77.5]WMW81817.1 OmpA family protein [Undibacterium sp. 20NA77.5]